MALARPRARRTEVTVVELDGEAVIYDRRSGVLHHLNAEATLVYRACNGRSTIAEVAAGIAEAVGEPVARIEPDVRAALRRLRTADLLETSAR